MLAGVIERVTNGELKRVMIQLPPRHALAVGTPIPTPKGWRAIETLEAGDYVFGPDGKAVMVLGRSEIFDNRDVWAVSTDDGATVFADADHLWNVRLCRKHPVFHNKTTQYLADRASPRRPMLPSYSAVEYPEADLPVPPYVLGAWLGDGHSKQAIMTGGVDDLPLIRTRFEALGVATTNQATLGTFGTNGLKVKLRELGVLGNKHIPAIYLTASIKQRMELLRGLMDTDGNVSKDRQCFYNTTSPALRDDVVELIRSLGWKASIGTNRAKLYGKDCGEFYRISFYGTDCATFPRKNARATGYIKATGRYLSFEKAGKAETVCITVDRADGLFLCGRGYMVTHNSKSELFSRLFSAYYLHRNPHHFVGINSYSADLAYTLSRAARENFIQCGGVVKDDVAAVKHWETNQGGGLWAAGVGGSITGKGFHLGIIDDPLKNAEEAASEVIREKHKEWYSSTFYTRQEPGAAIVIIQTRWHEDDLTGWLLSEEIEGDQPENWHVVCLPAIAEEQQHFPDTCEVEADKRQEGEALCPERYDEAKLSSIKARIGEYHFGALYQQRPSAKQGLFFHVDKLQIVDAAPVEARRARGWDKAATAGGGDFTAGVKIAKHDGLFYIEDVIHGQWDTATRDRTIRQTAEMDGRACKQVGEQEPGSGGKESAQNFIRLLAGFPVTTEPATNAKEIRADPFSSQVNAGNVRIVRGAWNKGYIEELRTFPHGKHDDRVDGSSLAFNELNGQQVWSVSTRTIR